MTIGLLLITHSGIGNALLSNAKTMVTESNMLSACLEIDFDADLEKVKQQAEQLVNELDQGQGVLILTDVYGATPSNIACQLLPAHMISIVTGVNLPMLLKVLNYEEEDLDSLAQKACQGGQQHIREISVSRDRCE